MLEQHIKDGVTNKDNDLQEVQHVTNISGAINVSNPN
jgi:hypothetical protein